MAESVLEWVNGKIIRGRAVDMSLRTRMLSRARVTRQGPRGELIGRSQLRLRSWTGVKGTRSGNKVLTLSLAAKLLDSWSKVVLMSCLVITP